MSDDESKTLTCPRCGSADVGVRTTVRWDATDVPDGNPNRASCRTCKHAGNSGDWFLIQSIRRSIAAERREAAAAARRAATQPATSIFPKGSLAGSPASNLQESAGAVSVTGLGVASALCQILERQHHINFELQLLRGRGQSGRGQIRITTSRHELGFMYEIEPTAKVDMTAMRMLDALRVLQDRTVG